MKKAVTFLFVFISISCFSQYHVKVQPNPSNNGEVNPSWLNNYVISYTNDNWKSYSLLHTQLTWQGFDDNGKYYYTSSFDPISFKTKEDALTLARTLASYNSAKNYEAVEYKSHLAKKKKFEADNKKLLFNSKKTANKKGSTTDVY